MEKPNLEYISKLSRNNEEIRQKLIGILKHELPIEIEAYHVSLRLKQWEQTAECIHKLKNKIAVFGLDDSYHLADDYEKNVQNSSADLKNAFEKTLNLMQGFVNSL